MRSDTQLLVIGPESFRTAVDRALPSCKRVGTDEALAGLWQAGQQPFQAVLLSLDASKNVFQAIRSLRRVGPQLRIVVTCAPADEPRALQALNAGADEYVIEPVSQQVLERVLRLPLLPQAVDAVTAPEPSYQEKAQFVEVLKGLPAGPQATLDRMADLLRQTFDATSAAIRIDDLATAVGEPGDPVLQESIRRDDAPVGLISLGRRRKGSYAASVAARLADYARLVEVVIAAARERSHWQDLAWTDDLSGLRNRRYFERRLDQLIERCAAQHICLTVLLFDIDDFKDYNDRFGHETGDALIREVAYLLTRCSREPDVVARYGGDEFAIILWDAERPRVPGSKHPSEPMALADRFRQMITSHDFKCLGPDAPGTVTISGGLACYPWDGHNREQLLRSADEALLVAKRIGKNRIELAGAAQPPADE